MFFSLVVEIEYVEQIGLKLDTLYMYMNCKLREMEKEKSGILTNHKGSSSC